LDEVSVVTSES
jgi:hypothetical protein